MDYKKSYHLLQAGVLGGAVAVFIGLGLSMKIVFLGNSIAFIGLAAMLGGISQALTFHILPKLIVWLMLCNNLPNMSISSRQLPIHLLAPFRA